MFIYICLCVFLFVFLHCSACASLVTFCFLCTSTMCNNNGIECNLIHCFLYFGEAGAFP